MKIYTTTWKQAALRLARAIVRFQNDDLRWGHSDRTVKFALKIIEAGKQ
jgi:hypothetical protein